jgi:hypothetical protein
MKSIIQTEKECYVCHTTYNLQDHHIIYGTANRKQSEKYGLKVWLCQEHHTGNCGVHFNKTLDMHLKKLAQEKFNDVYGENKSFLEVFGKNYIY